MSSRRWLGAALVLFACSAPLPTATPSGMVERSPGRVTTLAPLSPPPTPTQTTAEPVPTPGLARYDAGGLTFEYPAAWKVVIESQAAGPDWIFVVVGTGSWADGCERSGNAVRCHGRELIAGPGEVVAEFAYRYSGPADSVYAVPGFESTLLASGFAAMFEDRPTEIRAEIYVPGHRNLTARVAWGSPPSDGDRSAAHDVIESVRYSAAGQRVTLRTFEGEPSGRECVHETLRGRLASGDFGYMNLAISFGPAYFAFLSWPSGWRGTTGEGRRLELRDDADRVVAREWDEVSVGGRGDANEFRVCPDAVTVVRPFPTK